MPADIEGDLTRLADDKTIGYRFWGTHRGASFKGTHTWYRWNFPLFSFVEYRNDADAKTIVRRIKSRVKSDPDSILRHTEHGGNATSYASGCCP